jgi:hypothetical protein
MSLSPSLENTKKQTLSSTAVFGAILRKEWSKLRWPWIALIVLPLVHSSILCLQVRRLFVLHDAANVWSTWLGRGYLFFSPYLWWPLGTALLLAVWQFLPELQNRRFRLSLHLPCSESRIVLSHLAVGLFALGTTLVLPTVIFALTTSRFFPAEFWPHLFWGLAPSFVGAAYLYFCAAATLLEPSWRIRAWLALLGAGLLPVFLPGGWYEVHARILPWLLLWTAACVLLPLWTGQRFREGRT